MKAQHCDRCAHASYQGQDPRLHCARGHRPRFYRPNLLYTGDWGWKRVCTDYQPKENRP
jgi:hypothetical protein